MRCPDCNKFVSYDEPECQLDSVEIDGSDVRASATVNLNCQECGTTLKEANIETETPIDHECDGKLKFDEDEQFEIEEEGEPSGTSRTQDKDRHGRQIKSARYMKTFYGFEMDTDVKCNKCGDTFTVTLEGEEQASGFNECR